MLKLAIALRENTTLKILSLKNNKLGTEAINELVQELIKNNSLEILNLSGNNYHLTDRLLKILEINKTLKQVILKNSGETKLEKIRSIYKVNIFAPQICSDNTRKLKLFYKERENYITRLNKLIPQITTLLLCLGTLSLQLDSWSKIPLVLKRLIVEKVLELAQEIPCDFEFSYICKENLIDTKKFLNN